MGRRNFAKYKEFVMTKRLRLQAVADFQRVYRGHKGREEAEVKQALKAIDNQTRPMFEKIKMLEKDLGMVSRDRNRMESFLKTSESTITAIEEELREVMQVKGAFYDSAKVTGTLQRFKTSYLQSALKATLDNIKARAEVEARALTQVERSQHELEKAIRIQERKLKPLLRNVEFDVREHRHVRLRKQVRDRQRGATMLQKLFRGHRVRGAIGRCGGVNYWIEAVDDDGLPYFFNTWSQEREDTMPFEMVLFGDIGGKGSKAAGTRSTKPAVDGTDWVEVFDEESGAPYYVNIITNEYQWNSPTGFDDSKHNDRQKLWLEQEHMSQLSSRGGQGKVRVAGPWRELTDEESGASYYQNMQSGDYTWEKPHGFDQEWLVSQDQMSMSARSDRGRKAGPWTELHDMETDTVYYFNDRSGEAVWEKPAGFDQRWLDQQDQAALIQSSRHLRDVQVWQEYTDDTTGAVYYYNNQTGETQWDKPRGFDKNWLAIEDAVQLSARSIRKVDAGQWGKYADEESGATYYYNSVTGEKSDTKPTRFLQDWLDTHEVDELEEVSTAGRVGGPWTEMKHDETETVFYIHFKTRDAIVEAPENFEDQHRMGTLRSGGRVMSRRMSGKGWTELMDTRTGNAYYHDRETRTYTWDKPASFDSDWLETQDIKKLVKRSKQGDSIGNRGWHIMSDPDTDTVYYFNEGKEEARASLSPRTAHEMDDPPSALGEAGTALAKGEILDKGGNTARKLAEQETKGGKSIDGDSDDDEAELLQSVPQGEEVPEFLRKKLKQIADEREVYNDRAEHVSWMENFIAKGEFLNASSVADQILVVQSETRTKLGKHLTEDGKAPPEEKTEEQLWQEQAYAAMLEEED